MQRSKIGIHTMTLARQVEYGEMEHIIDALGEYSDRTRNGFLYFRGGGVRRRATTRQAPLSSAASFSEMMDSISWNRDVSDDEDIQSPFLPKIGVNVSHPGLKEFSAFVYRYYDSTVAKEFQGYRSKYYIYLKVEPLMLVDGKQSIRLFELEGASNIEPLKEAFRREVADLFDIEPCQGGITELDTWNTDRMDYTIDVTTSSKDEILIFKNLCKWSVKTNSRNKSQYSARGDKFYDYGLLYGNKSWTLAIYDKYDQVKDTYNDIDAATKEKLMAQAKKIMRIEVRSEKGKVRSISQSLENGRNIMEFLDVDVALKLFRDTYGKEIGYKDFFRIYVAEKKLDEAFPMTRDEKKKDRDSAKEAQKQGQEYEHECHSNKYYFHRGFLMEVINRKGLKNVIKNRLGRLYDDGTKKQCEPLSEEDKKEKAAIMAQIRYELNKVIRDKVGISPVLIPEDWKYGDRKLDLPKEKLENPLSDLCPSV